MGRIIRTWLRVMLLGGYSSILIAADLPRVRSEYGQAASSQEHDFFKAVEQNDEVTVKRLLTQGYYLFECFDTYGNTPLMYAVKRGYIEIACLLVLAGARPTVLLDCAHTFEQLLAYHIDENVRRTQQFMLLFAATQRYRATEAGKRFESSHAFLASFEAALQHKNHEALMRLSAQSKHINDVYGMNALTPLALAILYEVPTGVLYELIRSSAVIDRATVHGKRLLPLAFEAQNHALASILLINGARVYKQDISGDWLHDLIEQGECDAACRIVDQEVMLNHVSRVQKITPLMMACVKGSSALVERLIALKVPLNVRESTADYTALFMAVRFNHPAIVRLLVKAGADVTLCSRDGYAPFNLAVGSQQINRSTMEALLQAGASINAFDNTTLSPLAAALLNSRFENARLLIRWGASIKAIDKAGHSWLEVLTADDVHVQESDCLALCHQIIESGHTLSSYDHWTLLNLVLVRRWYLLIPWLAQQGFNWSALMKNPAEGTTAPISEGALTPLIFGIIHNDTHLIEELLSLNVDYTIPSTIIVGSMTGLRAADFALMMHAYALAHRLDTQVSERELLIHSINAHQLKDVAYFIERNTHIINAVDDDGVTPLMSAIAAGHTDVVAYLLSHGANSTITTKRGWSALSFSRSLHNTQDIFALIERNHAESHARDLCAQEEKELAERRERLRKQQARKKKHTALVTSGGARGAAQNNTHSQEDQLIQQEGIEDDVDARFMALYIRKIHARETQQTQRARETQGARMVPESSVLSTIKRYPYAHRVKEWFEHPRTALLRREYIGIPEPLFGKIIFAHTLARALDGLSDEWLIFERQLGNTRLGRMLCLVLKNNQVHTGVLEYAFDTKEQGQLFHRYFNTIDKHPGMLERCMPIPQNFTPTESHQRISRERPARDGSYIVEKRATTIEIYDPKNRATILVIKPRIV